MVRACAYPSPMLRQSATALAIDTLGRGLFEITRPVAAWVTELGDPRDHRAGDLEQAAADGVDGEGGA